MTTFLQHKFSTTLRSCRGDLPLQSVTDATGLVPATISRAERGMALRIDTFVKLCAWMQVDPADFFMTRDGSQDISGIDVLKQSIVDCHELPPTMRNALMGFVNAAEEARK